MIGLLGKKVGMSQIFNKDGRQVAVTVLQVGPCRVTDIRSEKKDGCGRSDRGMGGQQFQRICCGISRVNGSIGFFVR